ncbi:ROK family protein [Actinomadura flavalba]|uniref:ROK family protein n=1 Tax=Actinomadura flavalba TaxID=1120938 RepID=UPI0004758C38|nr:ROK family protein [Actinomadura flavalba]
MSRRPATSGEVLRLVREGVATRADLGRVTGLSRPAVAARVAELLAAGLLTERDGGPSTGGRPPARLEFAATGGAVLVANLGHSRGQIAVCDLAGTVLAEAPADPPPDATPAQILPRVLDQWTDLLTKTAIPPHHVHGAALAIPAAVNSGPPPNEPPVTAPTGAPRPTSAQARHAAPASEPRTNPDKRRGTTPTSDATLGAGALVSAGGTGTNPGGPPGTAPTGDAAFGGGALVSGGEHVSSADRVPGSGFGAEQGGGVGVPGVRGGDPGFGWVVGDVAAAVRERFGVVADVENEANLAALGEHAAGAARGADDVLFVKVSTGIGAALIMGGRLQRGALGAAGEIGHVRVAEGGDVVCRCGGVGCLEAVAGGAALLARSPAADLAGLAALARGGDPAAVALVREAGRRIGTVVADAVNLLNPSLVVLGGDLTAAAEPLLAGVRAAVYERATAVATSRLRIEPSRLGDAAGLRGAAALALRRVLSPDAVDAALSAPRSGKSHSTNAAPED